MRHIVIFVVDGSGSMGVEQRMIQTKGAILSLLMDCYQKRDKVAMVVFRKDRAETILPPTSSHELALKRLKEIPTGGKTPLSAGLMETYNLIRRLKLKNLIVGFWFFLLLMGKQMFL
jgi:magnesium chelatase subunit D